MLYQSNNASGVAVQKGCASSPDVSGITLILCNLNHSRRRSQLQIINVLYFK
jgi:hypothetical protein